MENWKDVIGYDGIYQVSNHARVKSLAREWIGGNGALRVSGEKILKQGLSNGRPMVSLSKDGIRKSFQVSQLVALHFIPNPENHPFVLHLDDDPTNNSLSNLAWGTPKDNAEMAVKNGKWSNGGKLKFADISKIKEMSSQSIPQSEIATRFGLTQSAVCNILKGRSWKYHQ